MASPVLMVLIQAPPLVYRFVHSRRRRRAPIIGSLSRTFLHVCVPLFRPPLILGRALLLLVTATASAQMVAPSITTQPTSQTVTAGQPVTFSVIATGTLPLHYQWSHGTSPVGTDSPTFSIASASAADAGSYAVVVSNSVGSVTSNTATLTVNPAPVAPSITTQPTSQTVTTGQPVTFSVTATGTPPLHYQWRHGTSPVGTDSPTFSIASASAADAGSYAVVVSNSTGSVTSNTAALTVNPVNPAAVTVSWSPMSPITSTTPLGPAELNATATDSTGNTVPGNFVYTPPAGTLLHAGMQTLTAQFTPASTASFATPPPKQVTIQVNASPVTISWMPAVSTISTTTPLDSGVLDAIASDPNGNPVQGTFVYTPPAGTVLALGTQTLTVHFTPASTDFSAPPAKQITIKVVNAVSPAISFTGPSTSSPAEPQSLQVSVGRYPNPLNATLTLTFVPGAVVTVPSAGSVCDNSISLNNQTSSKPVCETPLNVTLPTIAAGSTFSGTIPLSVGSLTGDLGVTLRLQTADTGVEVTPATGNVVQIAIPPSPPVLKSTTIIRNGNSLQVDIQGLSDTREVTSASFHFSAAVGSSLTSSDFTLPVSQEFITWFQDPNSANDGGGFAYSQQFSVNGDSANISSVTVTLSNSKGTSNALTAQ